VWKKRTVEESYGLSIFDLKKGRLLEKEAGDWWSRKSNGLTLLCTQVAINRPLWPTTLIIDATLTDALGREHHLERREVQMTSTPCRFGSQRWWFICPGERCGRRVAKLYLPPGQNQYLCRHCHELTYEACQGHRDGMDTARRYARYRKRWEAARTTRQKIEWSLKLFQALDGLQAYQRVYHQRAMERIARMRKAAGIKGPPDISSVKL
jgi:hypothetical protein